MTERGTKLVLLLLGGDKFMKGHFSPASILLPLTPVRHSARAFKISSGKTGRECNNCRGGRVDLFSGIVQPLRGFTEGEVDVVVDEAPQPFPRPNEIPRSLFGTFGELAQRRFYRADSL